MYEEIPIPPPYSSPTSPTSPTTTFPLTITAQETNSTSAPSIDTEKYPEVSLPPGRLRDSVLLKIWQCRVYVRTITLLVTIASLVLILVGLVTYEKTKANKLQEIVDPDTGEEIYVEITTKPNVTFAAIGGVNTLLSGLLLVLCWKSCKVCFVTSLEN